jgi:ABC-type lipoprotein release transport system permease subunit
MRARAALRARRNTWVGLVILLGVAGGLVASAVAGAHRTASVYERLLERTDAFDLVVSPSCRDVTDRVECTEVRSRAIDALPSVATSARVATFLVPITTSEGRSLQPDGATCFTGSGEVDVEASIDGRFGTTVNRRLVVSGKDATGADEVLVSEATARRAGIEVGDRLHIVPIDACTDAPQSTWPEPIAVQVVGIHRSAGEIPPEVGFYLQTVVVAPAVRAQLERELGSGSEYAAIRMRETASVADFRSEARAAGIEAQVVVDQADFAAAIERGLRADVTTMWLLAAFGGGVALVLLGQALLRQVWSGSGDVAALRSMGATRRTFLVAGALEGAVVGGAAGLLAFCISIVSSPIWPIGRARRVEPDPGISFDPVILAVAASVAVLTALIVAVATRRIASARRILSPSTRRSWLDSWLPLSRVSPPVACGARMLRRPGRGAVAVPLRSAVAGAVLGLATLIGAVTFAAGLDHLESTPRLVGWNWDLAALGGWEPPDPDGDPAVQLKAAMARAKRIPGLERISFGTFFPVSDVPLLRDGPRDVWLMSFTVGSRAVLPTVITGRAPRRPTEILLTPQLLDKLGREIGDTIVVQGATLAENAPPLVTSARVEIVGTGAVPVGDGSFAAAATMTFDGLRRLSGHAEAVNAYADVAGGADGARVRHELRDLGFRGLASSDRIDAQRLVNLTVREADTVPRVLALLMALLATGVLAHLIATTVHARRLEFATLRAVGFTRGQRRATIGWLAATATGVSLAAAIPLGLIGGSIAWRLYATSLGVLPETVVPWIGVAIVIAASFLVSAAVAVIVARGVTGSTPPHADAMAGENV